MSNKKQVYRRLMKLEAFRGVSALYVFLHHYVHYSPELDFLKKFFVFGQFALMIFFVLSGFVIYYATVFRDPNISFWEFFLRRFRRIYPAFLLVLGLTYLIKCLTLGTWTDPLFGELLGNIFQLQDKNPYKIVGPYWQNAPLWSLAYEWWFYMIFFAIYAAFKGNHERQRIAALAVSVAGMVSFFLVPNQISLFASYFILWWAGLEVAREWTLTGKVTLKAQWGIWLLVFLMGGAWLANALIYYYDGGKVILSNYPYVQARHFFSVNIILLFGFTWYKLRWFLFNELFSYFERVAPISYAIYIFHYPVVLYIVTVRPTDNVWLDLLIMIPVVLGVSWLIEQPYQKFFNRLIKIRKSGAKVPKPNS